MKAKVDDRIAMRGRRSPVATTSLARWNRVVSGGGSVACSSILLPITQVDVTSGPARSPLSIGILNQRAVVRRAERRPSMSPVEGDPGSSYTEATAAS